MLLSDIYANIDQNQQEKFAALSPYLQNWTVEEAQRVGFENACKLIVVDDTLSDRKYGRMLALMKLFLVEFGNRTFPSRVGTGATLNAEIQDHNVLNYRRCLTSDLMRSFAAPGVTTLSALFAEMTMHLTANPAMYDKIQYVDFSHNMLLDTDAPMLKVVIETLRSVSARTEYAVNVKKVPDLIVDVRFVRFHGLQDKYRQFLDPSLFKILQMPFLKLLMIAGNLLVTYDRVSFFAEVYRNKSLGKLWLFNTVDFNDYVASAASLARRIEQLTTSEQIDFVSVCEKTFYENIEWIKKGETKI